MVKLFRHMMLPVLLAAFCAAQTLSIQIRVVRGDGGINDIQRKAGVRPVVEVRDGLGRPVSGASVTFTLPYSGPGGVFEKGQRTCTVNSGSDGRAEACALMPNRQEGRFNIRVSASYQGAEATAVIAQSNTLAVSTTRKASTKWLILGLVGGASAGIAMAVRPKGNDGPTPAIPTPPTSVSIGSVTVGGPR